MNKAIIPALLLTLGTAMAGEPTVTYVAPAPQPQKECPLTFELAGVYAFANRSIFNYGPGKEIDVYGGDITAVHKMDKNNSLNLRLGYSFGDKAAYAYGYKYETDVHSFYLMPGYRYTHALTDKTSLYLGANIGVTNLSVKDHVRGPLGTASSHNSEYGFGYSGEIGLRYAISENCELFAAYEFVGSTASPRIQYNGASFGTRDQTYHAIRAGASFRF